MRKILAIGVMFLLLAAFLSSAPAAEYDSFRYAEVVTPKGNLNMRAAPKSTADIVAKLPRGTIVRILEDHEDWMRILCKGKTGYVMTSFLDEYRVLPYSPIMKDDRGDAVLSFKKRLHKLGYLKSDDVNTRFDAAMETALIKLQLINGVPLNPGLVTPQLQALMDWDMLLKGKSGFLNTAQDTLSGLTVSVFCWDSAGMLYEEDRSVKIDVSFAAQATGGQPPYDITVRRSASRRGGELQGDVVTSPFSYIWKRDSEEFYVYATAVDAGGNTVTACTPFRYTLPLRYQ